MSITAYSGPVVSFGGSPYEAAQANPERGPSLFDQGGGLLDPRTPYTYLPGQNIGAPMYGFLGTREIPTLDVAAATAAAAAIAALANVASGTAMTLVSSSAAGIKVGSSVVRADTGATVTGLLVVDTEATYKLFGSTVRIWNPTTLLARAVSITGVSGGTGGAFLVSGYDIYGYPMSESITAGSGAGTTNGKKAFKWIASVVPQFTDAHNYSVGTTDIFGLALRADKWAETAIAVSSAWITASTGFVLADTTSPATTTTGDVRGTYALQTASDGTKTQQINLSPSVANIDSITGLFGVTQV